MTPQDQQPVGPDHYRLNDRLKPDGVVVRLEVFRVIKETPQGYWVASQYTGSWYEPAELINRKFARWVSKASAKRYCYPTLEEAIRSFKRRKEVQESKLRVQLEQAELAANQAGLLDSATLSELAEGVCLGHTASSSLMVWDW